MIMVTNNNPVQLMMNSKNNNARQEKPRHLKYLNEFRTQQCLLFLDQQCQFHRPFTCFHWHFPNQKRRKPFKRPDGTFNYNPDVYCDKYDENSGSCADGDDCPYAHKNAGDTERRYHPRYFKTGNCIYETVENGACVKNGLHCAFAHGPDDIRLPVYDIREVQDASSKFTVNLPASLEKERVLSEDPKWNEMFHVLRRYKTELCKKPPRMCRQGYSCPFYHNGKDKRRAPDKYFYRSTPCPVVRPGDEWQDSGLCETGDACIYCHTRTEQQFHPEIYKSTKCNDVLNSGYCPRGPFCAFAHCDSEMSIGRDFLVNMQQHDQYLVHSGSTLEPLSLNTNMLHSPTSSTTISHRLSEQSNASRITGSVLPPNLMANIHSSPGSSSISSTAFGPRCTNQQPHGFPSPGSTVNTPTALSVAPSRGRRVARCSSPRATASFWPVSSLSLPGCSSASGSVDRQSLSHMPAFVSSPTSTTSDQQSNTLCPTLGMIPVNPLVANLNQTHLSHSRSRPYSGQLQGVLANSLAAAAYARDKGRHRSGSSMSSSETGQFSGQIRDLTPPTSYLTTSTYPGRCGSYAGLNAVACPGSQHVKSTLCNTVTTMGSTSRPPTLSLGQYSCYNNSNSVSNSNNPTNISGIYQPGNTSRGLTNTDSSNNRGQVLPMTGNTSYASDYLWNPASESVGADQYFSSSTWAWPNTFDSGNNSGCIGDNESDFSNLLESCRLGVSSTGLCDDTSRDSGLVIDANAPMTPPLAPDHKDNSTAKFGQDNSRTVNSQYKLMGSGGFFDSNLNMDLLIHLNQSTPNRVSSGLFDDVNTMCSRFTHEVFHSPSDDGLHSATSNSEDPDSHPLLTTAPQLDSSLTDSSTSGPMNIPRKDSGDLKFQISSFLDTVLSQPIHTQNDSLPAQSNLARNAESDRSRKQDSKIWSSNLTDDFAQLPRLPTNATPPSSSSVTRFSPIVGTPLCHTIHSSANESRNPITSSTLGPIGSHRLHGKATETANVYDKFSNASSNQFPVATTMPCELPGTEYGIPPNGPPSGHTMSDTFPNVPQPSFNNPGYDWERMSLRRELNEVKQRLDSKEGELEVLKRQRDFVTEHLRDSLGVIRQLFQSFNVSPTDLSKPLFVDTETGSGSGQSTGCGPGVFHGCCATLSPRLEQSNQPKTDQNFEENPNAIIHFDSPDRNQLQQQQEALAALFANPFVSALLNPGTNADTFQELVSSRNDTMSSRTDPINEPSVEHIPRTIENLNTDNSFIASDLLLQNLGIKEDKEHVAPLQADSAEGSSNKTTWNSDPIAMQQQQQQWHPNLFARNAEKPEPSASFYLTEDGKRSI